MTHSSKILLAALIAICSVVPAFAQDIHVSIKNEGNSDFFLTPLWFGFHDGSFDVFDAGSNASASLEALAEGGDVSGLQADLTAAATAALQGVAANADGFGGAPVIDPGETAMGMITTINPANYRYFSYASMLIPSNDAFIANDNPMAYEIFDAAGNFNGTRTIQIFANGIWDAGTEVNNTMGAAFSAVGGTDTDEGGVIALIGDGGLDNFLGTGIPPGTSIGNLLAGDELLATITISQAAVPEPSSLALLGLSCLALGFVRRRVR